MTRAYFEKLLNEHPRVIEAAKKSGINRTDFYKRMAKLGLLSPGVGTANQGNEAWRNLK